MVAALIVLKWGGFDDAEFIILYFLSIRAIQQEFPGERRDPNGIRTSLSPEQQHHQARSLPTPEIQSAAPKMKISENSKNIHLLWLQF